MNLIELKETSPNFYCCLLDGKSLNNNEVIEILWLDGNVSQHIIILEYIETDSENGSIGMYIPYIKIIYNGTSLKSSAINLKAHRLI